jgi:hypothetical protein
MVRWEEPLTLHGYPSMMRVLRAVGEKGAQVQGARLNHNTAILAAKEIGRIFKSSDTV